MSRPSANTRVTCVHVWVTVRGAPREMRLGPGGTVVKVCEEDREMRIC